MSVSHYQYTKVPDYDGKGTYYVFFGTADVLITRELDETFGIEAMDADGYFSVSPDSTIYRCHTAPYAVVGCNVLPPETIHVWMIVSVATAMANDDRYDLIVLTTDADSHDPGFYRFKKIIQTVHI